MAQPSNDAADALWSLLEAVPNRFKAEIIEGVLHVSPRPSSDHQYTNYALSFFVGGPHMFDPHGPSGWWILSEPGVRVQIEEEFAPDHAGWRREKLPFLHSPITTAPDWVCEVLSPGKGERLDRDTKMPFYARLGIEWLWLIDTVRRDIEVYRLVSNKYERLPVVLSDEARLPPFESLALPLSRFWPSAGPGVLLVPPEVAPLHAR